jgi:hypothetical protein
VCVWAKLQVGFYRVEEGHMLQREGMRRKGGPAAVGARAHRPAGKA